MAEKVHILVWDLGREERHSIAQAILAAEGLLVVDRLDLVIPEAPKPPPLDALTIERQNRVLEVVHLCPREWGERRQKRR